MPRLLTHAPRSLGAKLVFVLTAVGLAGAAAITLLLVAVITPSFERLEAEAIAGHVERTRVALGDYAAKVENAVRDYGDWNASYEYMVHPGRAFEQESFSPLAMQNLDVSGMAYVTPDGGVVIARWLDPATGRDRPELRARLVQAIARLDLARATARRNSAHFYTRLGSVIAAIGVAQVRRSDGSGAPRGFVLMARTITSAQLSQLLQVAARLEFGNRPAAVPESRTVTIAVPVPGWVGQPIANATFAVPRAVSLLGQRMLGFAVAGTIVLLAVLLLVLRRLIARLVLAPLGRVEAHMQRVRASGALTLLEEADRPDEVGSLGCSFNAMLTQLKDLREQLEVQSFELGRTESAIAVMHNVRNALNPISTILSQGVAQPPAVDRALFERAVGELARDDLPPARREKLLAFLTAAVDAFARDRAWQREQLATGREAMRVVLDIIGEQQAHAHERPVLEPVDVTAIVAQNAALARYAQGLSIAFSFPAQPFWVLANRVILSQVIGNLFGNAGEAIAAGGADTGSITVSAYEQDGRTTISIRDDGEGFAPETTAGLFQRGFSTRAHKSGGLGLHWCANSMNAMGGGLRLESAGRGLGASAILTLPSAPAEMRAAA
ncbi:CHASE4 domain-containing protein [Sphingomonas aracearum]|uniref:histidine kinase n=1 Tax=Sphingomonas aracearum TaxID=2283317 RepID=A0A369VZC7_9SPHN|nr:CHASE4 domain-containing protein [Sphingomonas aracearum]RDE06985.1 HAMP domain-containing protein [Sphingomonas aracearum]